MSKKNDVFKHVFSKDRVFNYYFDVKDEHKLSKFDFNNKIFSSLSSTAGITNNEKEQAYEEYSKLYDSLEKKHHDKSANVIRKIAKSKLIDPIMAKKKEEQQKKNMAAIKIQTKIRELNLKKR